MSGLSLPSGITILFVVKGEGSGESRCPLQSSAWVKGPSSMGWSSTQAFNQFLLVSCSICKQLFWIDISHFKQREALLLQHVLPGNFSKCRQI